MSDSTTYIIVTAESLEALAAAVEAKVQDGYVVSGAPYVAGTGYAQSMILASALSPIDFPEAVVRIDGAYIGNRTKEGDNPVYYVGDKVEPEEYGATLTLKSGATRSLFQDDFYVSPREISSTSDATVKVIYKWEKGFEDEVTIVPKAVALTSIVVQDMPRKTTYVVGQTFTGVDGLEVTALYNNNSLKRLPASAYTVDTEDVNTSAAGTYDVIVSYPEGSITKTTTFNIKVVVNTPVALEVQGNAKLQYVGKTIDASGLTFKATMLDGSIKDVTEDVTSDAPETLTDIGTKAVTFSYTENSVTASVVKYFNVTTMKPVARTMTGEFANQYINTEVNTTGLTFKVGYDDGDVADVASSVTHTPSTWGGTVGIRPVVFTYSASGVTLTLTKSVEVQEAQQGSSYLKYSSDIPFKFAPVEYVEGKTGEVIVPTGTLSNLYVNCDATAEEVEEAFRDLPYTEENGYCVYAISEVEGTGWVLGLAVNRENSINSYEIVFMSSMSSAPYFFRYNGTAHRWEESSDFGSSWEETEGLKTITIDPPIEHGLAQLSNGTVVGSANDKLTKIFSFNEEFSEGGYQPASADTPRWDGTLQYHVGSEPTGDTVWTNFPAEGTACDWIEVGAERSGEEIVPTGTLTKIYLNCDATTEDMEEAFGDIPAGQWFTYPRLGSCYGAYSNGIDLSTGSPLLIGTILVSKSGGMFQIYLADDDREGKWKDFFFMDGQWYDATGAKHDWEFIPVSGIQELSITVPTTGLPSLTIPALGLNYTIGQSNNKLTKIFSFNEPFGEAVEPNLYIRGTGNSTIVGEDEMVTFQTKAIGSSSPQISLSGKLMALFDYNNPESARLPDEEFGVQRLFTDDENLTDASGLILPSTLAAPVPGVPEWDGGCLGSMFWGCTALETAPALPATELTNDCYSDMFRDCTSLATAPELPATTLTDGCYWEMFCGCESLETAPGLPATELADYCYGGMFCGCTSLAAVPSLPAVTLKTGCYQDMFENCTSLTALPALPATTLAADCYYYMFGDCSIKLSKEDPEDGSILYRIPSGSESASYLGEGNPLSEMFNGTTFTAGNNWMSDDGTPVLTDGVWEGFVTPVERAPNYLKYSSDKPFFFYLSDSSGRWESEKSWNGEMQYATGNEPGEGNWLTLEYDELYSAIAVKSDVPASDGKYNIYLRADPDNSNEHILTTDFRTKTKFMTDSSEGPGYFPHVTVSGNIMALFNSTDPDSATLPTDTYALSGLFEEDSNIVDASGLVLPSTLVDLVVIGGEYFGCLSGMFKNCTSLETAPALPATTLTESCYEGMFSGCASLTAAPELPATELADYCYYEMFKDCTSLTTVPALPATELASYCYQYMFSGCSIKLSQTETEECPAEYGIPSVGSISSTGENPLYGMFGPERVGVNSWLTEDGAPILTNETSGTWTAFISE